MQFDSADMDVLAALGELLPVVKHEMGHVLGIGTIWDRLELLRNPSLPSNPGADTYFAGERAIAAFDEAGGGTIYTLGNKVPVANVGGPGSADGHWRESVLDNELMTPGFNSGSKNPLSAITIESLADLGYTVDVTQAEPFSAFYTAPSRDGCARHGDRPGRRPEGRADLGGGEGRFERGAAAVGGRGPAAFLLRALWSGSRRDWRRASLRRPTQPPAEGNRHSVRRRVGGALRAR